MTDLMLEFWETTRERLTELKPGQYEAVLEALVTHMDRRGARSAAPHGRGAMAGERDALLSLNVLVEGPGSGCSSPINRFSTTSRPFASSSKFTPAWEPCGAGSRRTTSRCSAGHSCDRYSHCSGTTIQNGSSTR